MTQVVSGARAIFKIGDKAVAVASNCSYTWAHNHQAVEVLGRESAAEHAELGMTIEFTADTFRVAAKSITELGFAPKLQDFLTQAELSASIEDKVTNKTLFEVTGVKLSNRAGTVNARGVWTESLTFIGQIPSDDAGKQENSTGTPPYPGLE